MMFPLVQDLADEGFPVSVTCGVLKFSSQAFYKWRARPICDRDWDDAHLVNAIVDVHTDDPDSECRERGAQFLTPPKQHQYEIRCYIRDPDGHLIDIVRHDEVGQHDSLWGRWALGWRDPPALERRQRVGAKDSRGNRRSGGRRTRQPEGYAGGRCRLPCTAVFVVKDVIEIADALGDKSLVVPSNPVGLDAQGKVVRLLPEGQSSGQVVTGWLRVWPIVNAW